MTGAHNIQYAQALNNHNLANVSTTGFQRDLGQARTMPVFGDGLPSRVYALTERPGLDAQPGPLQTTGNALDIAVDGDGWIAVQAADGSEAYTRRGDLKVSIDGRLTTGAGDPVLGDGGPIALPPADRIEIGDDGTISIVPQGESATTLVVVERIKLVKPEPGELEKNDQGLATLREEGAATPADASVRLASGVLEGSNVNAADALVTMLELSRQFELQIKMMKASGENSSLSNRLLRLE